MPRDPVPQQASPGPQRRIGYSVREVAQQLPVSEPFIRLEIKRGNLQATKLGRRVIILAESMNKWLEQGTWLSGAC